MSAHWAINLNLGLRWAMSCYWDLTTSDTDAPSWVRFWSLSVALGPVAIGLVVFRELGR